MLPAFKAGVGGRLGHGQQWMSWIALDDALGLLYECLMDSSVSGPINLVAPNPVRNSTFTDILGKVIRRPTIFPIPKVAIRTLFGGMGQTLLLEGRRVENTVADRLGFQYQFPDLESAFRFELGRYE